MADIDVYITMKPKDAKQNIILTLSYMLTISFVLITDQIKL